MRAWQAIKRSTDALGDAAHYAENTRFYIEGELQRRHGLVKFSASTGGQVISSFWHPDNGPRAIFFLSTGAIVDVAAT